MSTDRVENPAKATGWDTRSQSTSRPLTREPSPASNTKDGTQSSTVVSATTCRLTLSARSSAAGVWGITKGRSSGADETTTRAAPLTTRALT